MLHYDFGKQPTVSTAVCFDTQKYVKPCYLFTVIRLTRPMFLSALSVPAHSRYSLLSSITVFKLWRKLTCVCAGACRQRRAIIILRIDLSMGLDIYDRQRSSKIGGRVTGIIIILPQSTPPLCGGTSQWIMHLNHTHTKHYISFERTNLSIHRCDSLVPWFMAWISFIPPLLGTPHSVGVH